VSTAQPTILLDGNVLIALSVDGHVHRETARQWLVSSDHRFATCPITQGTLLRAWLRAGGSAESAKRSLSALLRNPRHDFWVDDLGYEGVPLAGIVGHRQVTDAYLAALARSRDGRLATFDRGLAAAHGDITMLITP
jgi:toxin-antitoxin system PIN domain toxin